NGICRVANPRKVSNLAAVCALYLPFYDAKPAAQTNCKQPLGKTAQRKPSAVGYHCRRFLSFCRK
ncbi:hypothetical protein, partial [Neisseria bacilliformis]|uniref:hypothetical protein n=1 Tax=Neisseria bacilliformis TaxID=267212 RepID=UPI00128BC047